MDGSQLSDFLGSANISGWDILIAALIAVAGWVVSIFVKRGLTAVLARTPGITPAVSLLIARVAKYLVILLGIGIGLSFLGASVQPLLTVAIIVGIVLVLALRGIADNFAAGVVLQSRHPLKPGDEIEVGDYIGTVVELNGRSVVIRTVDGRTVHVPNNTLLQDPLVNHSAAGARRSDIEVRVANGVMPIDELAEMLKTAASGVDGVHKREPSQVRIVAVSPQRVTTRVQFWHHPLHGVAVSSDVVQALAAACADHKLQATVTSKLPEPPLTKADEV